MMTLKIAIRNIFRHKARSLITLSTIMFGCVALIFVGAYFEDVYYQMREAYIGAQTGHIQVFKKGFNKHGKIKPYDYLIDNADEVKELLGSIPEISFVTARLEFSGLISTGDNTVSFLGQGVEPQNERMATVEQAKDLRWYVDSTDMGLPETIAGFPLSPEDIYEVMLGRGLSEAMKIPVNTPLVLITNTIHGATNALDVNVKGFFETASEEFDNVYLRIPFATAQQLLDTTSVQSLVVKLHKTDDTDAMIALLKDLFRINQYDFEIKAWYEITDFYNKTVELFSMFHLIMIIVTSIVVILGIFNTMSMAVMERYSEIGTLMALGVRRRGVMKLFFLEGLFVGAIGGALGAALGFVVVSIVAAIGIEMPPPPGGTFSWLSTPKIVPREVFLAFLLSVVVGGISSLYPAFKASRLQITSALRYR